PKVMPLRWHDRRLSGLVKLHRSLLLSEGGENSLTTPGEYCMTADNFFDATVSGDAAGIIVSLFTFSHLSFLLEDDPHGPRIAQYFHLLRDFAANHPEAGLIVRAID
ncbi:MAG: antirestriction protein, partial [Nitrospira sp.]|nr:antirestriction protein [Nitrospira sp.]